MPSVFSGHGFLIDGMVFLSPRKALPFLEKGAILVDLREELEKNGREFEVKALIALPFGRLKEEFSMLPRDRPLILADCVGINSKEGLRFLLAQGYESIASLIGGMVDWETDGMPLLRDRREELTGSCTCRLKPKKLYRPPSGC